MSKLFRNAALLSAALVVMTTGWALASPVEVLKIDIPFAFHAGDATLPAGTYTISKLDESEPTAIALRSADSRVQVDLLTESRQMYQTPQRTELRFLDFAGDHYLSRVSLKDQRMGWELQKSPGEGAGNERRKVEGRRHSYPVGAVPGRLPTEGLALPRETLLPLSAPSASNYWVDRVVYRAGSIVVRGPGPGLPCRPAGVLTSFTSIPTKPGVSPSGARSPIKSALEAPRGIPRAGSA